MAGRRGLILGVANDHSIAWGIAQSLSWAGAELAFTYQDEAFRRRVEPLAHGLGSRHVLRCDVAEAEQIDRVFAELAGSWPGLDFLVHAVAYSDKAELRGRYIDTTRENFRRSLAISCYSFTALARRAAAAMPRGGALVTLSYLGGQRVMPSYNVMGVAKAALEASVRYLAVDLGRDNIRVNAISAGPMRTLAGSAIGDARYVWRHNRAHAPLRRNVSLDEIGGTALYLLSDLSRGVTGEIVYVDAGFHVIGIPGPGQAEAAG
ncbi:MAG: SDR family oxidoreductase [Alphaproteobacteria bacterium]|nr:SDR family oxidoreductase [Alphaproteobacteria bacterium]